MKKLFLIAVVLIMVAFTGNEFPNKSLKFAVENDSEVSISGTSNVNSFSCCYNIAKLDNPIPVRFENRGENMVFDSTLLELENSCFDCGHKAINKDFNKLLKTEIYPKIKLQLVEIETISEQENTFDARVKIHIANTSKTYLFPVHVVKEKGYHIKGDLNLNLADFKLEAPKKMMGLIVVHDEIVVSFNLHLKQV